MSLKPIILYGHASGPNPWKVLIFLEELNVPYEHKLLEFPAMKQEPYESVNPNGRVPAIEDPNTGIQLFESGAIVEYLVDTYDKEKKLSYESAQQKWSTKSWLHFQMSGQGPYFGQFMWFSYFHAEKGITSAIDRYRNEIKRVWGVIDRHLKKTGTEYLVGDKPTYADLAFVPWDLLACKVTSEHVKVAEEFPTFYAWHEKLKARPSVQAMIKAKEAATAK